MDNCRKWESNSWICTLMSFLYTISNLSRRWLMRISINICGMKQIRGGIHSVGLFVVIITLQTIPCMGETGWFRTTSTIDIQMVSGIEQSTRCVGNCRWRMWSYAWSKIRESSWEDGSYSTQSITAVREGMKEWEDFLVSDSLWIITWLIIWLRRTTYSLITKIWITRIHLESLEDCNLLPLSCRFE